MANALIPQRIEQTSLASVCLHGRMTQEAAVRSLERHIVRPLRADLFAVHLKAESIGKNKAKVVSMADLLPWLNATGRLVTLVSCALPSRSPTQDLGCNQAIGSIPATHPSLHPCANITAERKIRRTLKYCATRRVARGPYGTPSCARDTTRTYQTAFSVLAS